MKKITTFLSIFICLVCLSQNTSIVAGNQYVSLGNVFDLPTPNFAYDDHLEPNTVGDPEDGYDGQEADHTANIVTKPNGDIHFFIVDGLIYDGEGQFIDYLNDHTGLPTKAKTEILIIPFNNECGKYYLIYNGDNSSSSNNYISIPVIRVLDMNAPNAYSNAVNEEFGCDFYGAIDIDAFAEEGDDDGMLTFSTIVANSTPAKLDIELEPYVPADLSSGKHNGCMFGAADLQPDGSRMLFVTNEYGVYSIKLQNGNFNAQDYIAYQNHEFNMLHLRTELEVVQLSNGNYRVASVYENLDVNTNETIHIIDVAPNGVFLTNSLKEISIKGGPNAPIGDSFTRGLEFSPSGDYLYLSQTKNGNYTHGLRYYDVATNTGPFNITTNQDFQYSFIETGQNGNLIMANANGLFSLTDAENPQSSITQIINMSISPSYESNPGDDDFKGFIIQDQIDDMDYTVSFTDNVACCIASSSYDTELFATNSGVWNGNNPITNSSTLTVRKELRIPAGETLTIKNQTIKFAEGARLVIENGTNGTNGGRLILDNTTLTADDRCGGTFLWLGVEVWGNQNDEQAQLNSTQGKLEMINGAVIEHAEVGILLSARRTKNDDSNDCEIFNQYILHGYDNARNGGIGQIRNSEIKNCRRGLYARKYQRPNGANTLSFVRNSTLIWENPLNGTGNYFAQVHLDDVKGFSVSGSDLINLDDRVGYGVYSRNSQFYVQGTCSQSLAYGNPCPTANLTRSKVENFSTGVFAINWQNDRTLRVNDTDFENNKTGIYNGNIDNQKIYSNNFKILESDNFRTVGVYLNRCDQYFVTENSFEELDNPTVNFGDGLSYGIVVNNSGEAHNEIYKNHFKNLHVGGQSQGLNGSAIQNSNNTGTTGLQWKCNDFDKQIFEADLTVIGRIDYEQGMNAVSLGVHEARLRAARNSFSNVNEPFADEHDIMNDASNSLVQDIVYYHLGDADHTPDSYTAGIVNPNLIVDLNNSPIYVNSATCPSKLHVKTLDYKGKYTVALDSLNANKLILENGASEDLIDLIAGSSNDNEVYTSLESESPYLSDAILTDYLNSGRDKTQIKDILILNSPLTAEVYQLVAVSDLTANQISEIGNYQTGISARKTIEGNVKYFNDYARELSSELTGLILLEDESAELANKVSNLQFLDNNDADRVLLDYYLSTDNTAAYNALKSQIVNADQEVGYQDFQTQLETIVSLVDIDSSLINDANLLNDIETLTTDFEDEEVGLKAKFILNDEFEAFIVPEIWTFNSGRETIIIEQDQEEFIAESNILNSIKVYPVPTEGIINILFDAHESKSGALTIFNLSGEKVAANNFVNQYKVQLDLSYLEKGIYILKFVSNEQEIVTKKIVISE